MTGNMTTTLAKIDQVTGECSLAKLGDVSGIQRAVIVANGMKELRALISGPVLDTLCELQGTDRDGKDKAYPKAVVRDCLIEGALRGAAVAGNEINIIAGRCYLTKNYFERMLREHVERLRVIEGVPIMGEKGALVPMVASWMYRGHEDHIECTKTADIDNRICVRVNAGMGVDAIIGKAYRKLYARIYRRVTGSDWIEAEVSEPDAIDTTAAVVESEPETTPDSEQVDNVSASSDAEVLATAASLLPEMAMVTDVHKYHSDTSPHLTSDESRTKLDVMCKLRCDEIRATRGPRSND